MEIFWKGGDYIHKPLHVFLLTTLMNRYPKIMFLKNNRPIPAFDSHKIENHSRDLPLPMEESGYS